MFKLAPGFEIFLLLSFVLALSHINFIHPIFLHSTQWGLHRLLQRWPLKLLYWDSSLPTFISSYANLPKTDHVTPLPLCSFIHVLVKHRFLYVLLRLFFLSCQLRLSTLLFDFILQFNLSQEVAPAHGRKYTGLGLWGQSVSPGAAAGLLGHNLPPWVLIAFLCYWGNRYVGPGFPYGLGAPPPLLLCLCC